MGKTLFIQLKMGSSAGKPISEATKTFVNSQIQSNSVLMFSKSYCPYCTKAKSALNSIPATFKSIELDTRQDMDEIQDYLQQLTGARSVPRVFVNGQFYGGGDDTAAGARNGELKRKIEQ